MEVINEIRDDKNADILMLLVLSFVKGIKFGANGNERKIAQSVKLQARKYRKNEYYI